MSALAPMTLRAFSDRLELKADDDGIELLLSEVKGKDITELIASRREKLASVPSGGGVVVVASNGGSGAAPAATEPKKEEKGGRERGIG
ncbi:60S acidic ribosomal protein P2 [Vitis vinifera]|uniref:60S acidic ribosomal protein P2 n=1 Tax=Vitis vinifera TaxID=29760 RepID=A0A438CJD8_VITVI|nr:60S acidic ribosomal protein P2 [Vitis vinifera]